jgi:hypothetical protein
MPGQIRTRQTLSRPVVVLLTLLLLINQAQRLAYAAAENAVTEQTGQAGQTEADGTSLQQLQHQLQAAEQQYKKEQSTLQHALDELRDRRVMLLKQQKRYQQQTTRLQSATDRRAFIQPAAISPNQALATPAGQSYFLKVSAYNRANKPLSSFLQTLEALYCAQTAAKAKTLLEPLLGLVVTGQGWPDEALGTGEDEGEARLYAGSVDIALSTLYRTLRRFPELTELAERVALQWNYCPLVGEEGELYNLHLNNQQVLKKKVATSLTLTQDGLQRWGFVPSSGNISRYVPELLDIYEPYYAYEIFLHRIHRQQCFPHPDSGRIYPAHYPGDQTGQLLRRALYPPPPTETEPYPFVWQPYCEIPVVAQDEPGRWPVHLLQRVSYKADRLQQQLTELGRQIRQLQQQQDGQEKDYLAQQARFARQIEQQAEHERQQRILAGQREQQQRERLAKAAEQKAAEQRRLAALAAEQQRIQQEEERNRLLALAAENKRKAQAQQQRRAAEADRQRRLQAEQEQRRLLALQQAQKQAQQEKRRAAERLAAEQARLQQEKITLAEQLMPADIPAEQFVPIPDAGAEGDFVSVINSAPSGTNKAQQEAQKLNLTTTFLYSAPLDGTKSAAKLNVSWAPQDNWFVRGSLKYVNSEELTYSWGVGYSNWRPGTTSIQLNNWGPLKRGDGLAPDKAVLSVSHKIDSETLRDNKLSAAVGLSKPLDGDPAANLTFQWSPFKNLYFRTTASQKLHGGPTKWSYGFGYYDWRPNTWRLEYSNYGDNRHPFDNFSAGAVTLNRAWQF